MSEQEPDATPTTTDPVRVPRAENATRRRADPADRVAAAGAGSWLGCRGRRGITGRKPARRRWLTPCRRRIGRIGRGSTTRIVPDRGHGSRAGWQDGHLGGSLVCDRVGRRGDARLAAVLVADRRRDRGPDAARPVAPTSVPATPDAAGSAGAGSDRAGTGLVAGTSPICAARGAASRSRRTRSSTSTPASSSATASRNAKATHLAVEMFEAAFAEHGVTAGRSCRLRAGDALQRCCKDHLDRSRRRPRPTTGHEVSNDNPFSESEFRTMKYRPNYPGTFDDDRAGPGMDRTSTCPGTTSNHRHSGIAPVLPGTRSTTAAWA